MRRAGPLHELSDAPLPTTPTLSRLTRRCQDSNNGLLHRMQEFTRRTLWLMLVVAGSMPCSYCSSLSMWGTDSSLDWAPRMLKGKGGSASYKDAGSGGDDPAYVNGTAFDDDLPSGTLFQWLLLPIIILGLYLCLRAFQWYCAAPASLGWCPTCIPWWICYGKKDGKKEKGQEDVPAQEGKLEMTGMKSSRV